MVQPTLVPELAPVVVSQHCPSPLNDNNVTSTVAPITDDVLLGADLMQDGADKPFDMLMSEDCIRWKGVSIPLAIVTSPTACTNTRHIYAADHYVITGLSEMIVDVYIDR